MAKKYLLLHLPTPLDDPQCGCGPSHPQARPRWQLYREARGLGKFCQALQKRAQTKVFGITLVVMQFVRELVTVHNWWADRQAEKAKSEGDLTKPATRVEVSQVKEDLQAMRGSRCSVSRPPEVGTMLII
ncbi:hypothetical protein N7519_007192 [Penicillium mononematosum]|uniref:uncharacterized protein n=1 Tax=Penicillium mononematosum TaxID=268346 RepID=UPI002547F0FA|nr:uncharacterized protein N7519_007192 [Penicillium mononematosum]KAJ6185891.1 hypothetical protein N7519_007192 [Penicillium mononematosum]